MATMAAENVIAALDGKKPLALVNEEIAPRGRRTN
jgi:hypothetical protein